MKNFLVFLSMVLLCGCVNEQPRTDKCVLVYNHGLEKFYVNKGDYLCFSEVLINKAKSKHYSEKDFNAFIDYSLANNKHRQIHNRSGHFPLIGTREEFETRRLYYVDKQGNRIPDETTIHIFDTDSFRIYDEKKSTEDTKKRLKKEEQSEVNRLESKYNLKFCRYQNSTNCLIRIPFGGYVFLQHINEGTLITTRSRNGATVGPNYYQGAETYLIIGNTDKYLQEGNMVSEGEFKVLGEYFYKSIRGVEKKAIRIQRLK